MVYTLTADKLFLLVSSISSPGERRTETLLSQSAVVTLNIVQGNLKTENPLSNCQIKRSIKTIKWKTNVISLCKQLWIKPKL